VAQCNANAPVAALCRDGAIPIRLVSQASSAAA
jgi:hypothetical protein